VTVEETHSHTFTSCPSCGGKLVYPTKADVECSDCGDQFCHEIRGSGRQHLLWEFSHENGLETVVKRASGNTQSEQ
jgi:predicted RNA-binding Zn-ribbon protein involved in translation (DUF1610 family)